MQQTLGAPDQHHTTIYSLNERCRGVHNGRFVVLMPADDIVELGLVNGQPVDEFSEWPAEPDRVLRGYRVVACPTVKGCAAMYFPEANVLVPRDAVDRVCTHVHLETGHHSGRAGCDGRPGRTSGRGLSARWPGRPGGPAPRWSSLSRPTQKGWGDRPSPLTRSRGLRLNRRQISSTRAVEGVQAPG